MLKIPHFPIGQGTFPKQWRTAWQPSNRWVGTRKLFREYRHLSWHKNAQLQKAEPIIKSSCGRLGCDYAGMLLKRRGEAGHLYRTGHEAIDGAGSVEAGDIKGLGIQLKTHRGRASNRPRIPQFAATNTASPCFWYRSTLQPVSTRNTNQSPQTTVEPGETLISAPHRIPFVRWLSEIPAQTRAPLVWPPPASI